MRLSHPHHVTVISSHGVDIRLISNSAEMFPAFRPLLESNLPGFEIKDPDTPCDHEFAYRWNPGRLDAVFKDRQKIDDRRIRDNAFMLLASQMRVCVAEFAPEHIFIHAGAVAVDGKAIIIPARSYHGKTTLTAALVRKGALYYSDEFAVIDGKGRLHPFPKELSMRGILPGRQQLDMPVEAFGGKQGTKPVPIGLVIVTEYGERSRWRPKKLSAGQGFLEIISHTVPIRQNTQFAMQALGIVLANAPVYKSKRGDADAAADAIIELARSK